MNVTPYIFFDGNCAEALDFYEKALGAKIEAVSKYGETPAAGQVPPALHDKVIHARINIGNNVIMFSDAHEEGQGKPHGYSLTIGVDTPAEAEKLFAALSDGGHVVMPMDKTFFAEKFGSVHDRFGIPWMIICEKAG